MEKEERKKKEKRKKKKEEMKMNGMDWIGMGLEMGTFPMNKK